MQTAHTTALITGASRGLGFEVARQLVAAGRQVWIGARDEARGRQAAETLRASFVRLDVTDDASVAAAAEWIGALDGRGQLPCLRLVQGRAEHVHDSLRRGVSEDEDQLSRSGLHRDGLQRPSRNQTVEEGAEVIVRYALIPADGPTGGLFRPQRSRTLVDRLDRSSRSTI